MKPLTRDEYEMVFPIVLQTLEDTNVTTYPLDLIKLYTILGIPHHAYNQCDVPTQQMEELSSDGFQRQMPGSDIPTVYVNTAQTFNRIKFTLAHELGHIMCVDLKRNTDPERTADAFAGLILAPIPLVMATKQFSVEDISYNFSISRACAQIAARDTRRRLNARDYPLTSDERKFASICDIVSPAYGETQGVTKNWIRANAIPNHRRRRQSNRPVVNQFYYPHFLEALKEVENGPRL